MAPSSVASTSAPHPMAAATKQPVDLLGEVPFWARSVHGGVAFADIPVRPGGHLPSFFIIGAPKAATTSLQAYLSQHPGLHMCEPKEPHFFSTDPIYARGLDWYKGLFADAKPGQICGEASTSYSRFPHTPDVPQRIHDVVPDAKFIYLVREPVSRVNSACMYALRRQQTLRQDHFEFSVDGILHQADFIADTSEYIVQLEHYLRVFDRSQLLVLLQEDLADDPEGTLRRTFEFLGVDPGVAIDSTRRLNETKAFVDNLKRQHISGLVKQIPGLRVLKRLVPGPIKRRVKGLLARRVAQDEVVKPMSAAMRAELQARFAPFNERLAAFLDRDLSHWS